MTLSLQLCWLIISIHSSTKLSLFELLYGQKPALIPLLYNIWNDSASNTPEKHLNKLTNTITELQSKAFSNIYKAKVNALDYNKWQVPLKTCVTRDKVLYHYSLGFY